MYYSAHFIFYRTLSQGKRHCTSPDHVGNSAYTYCLNFFLNPANPIIPVPNNNIVAGSGTGDDAEGATTHRHLNKIYLSLDRRTYCSNHTGCHMDSWYHLPRMRCIRQSRRMWMFCQFSFLNGLIYSIIPNTLTSYVYLTLPGLEKDQVFVSDVAPGARVPDPRSY